VVPVIRERFLVMSSMILVVAAALLSSLATVSVLWLVAKRTIDRKLAAAGDELADRVRAAVEEGAEAVVPRVRDAVRSGLDESVASALPTVRDQVAAGVRDGAETVVPKVREEVRQGVEEAIASAVTGGVVGKAGEELARKGSSVLNRILRGMDDG
jgi:hypothetical protein